MSKYTELSKFVHAVCGDDNAKPLNAAQRAQLLLVGSSLATERFKLRRAEKKSARANLAVSAANDGAAADGAAAASAPSDARRCRSRKKSAAAAAAVEEK